MYGPSVINLRRPMHVFSFSAAEIPFLGGRFLGIIAVLQIQSEEYRFATYYGAKILSIVQEKDYLVITIKQQQLKLTLAVLQKTDIY